jgi:hypothetical protein
MPNSLGVTDGLAHAFTLSYSLDSEGERSLPNPPTGREYTQYLNKLNNF